MRGSFCREVSASRRQGFSGKAATCEFSSTFKQRTSFSVNDPAFVHSCFFWARKTAKDTCWLIRNEKMLREADRPGCYYHPSWKRESSVPTAREAWVSRSFLDCELCQSQLELCSGPNTPAALIASYFFNFLRQSPENKRQEWRRWRR